MPINIGKNLLFCFGFRNISPAKRNRNGIQKTVWPIRNLEPLNKASPPLPALSQKLSPTMTANKNIVVAFIHLLVLNVSNGGFTFSSFFADLTLSLSFWPLSFAIKNFRKNLSNTLYYTLLYFKLGGN